MKRIFILIAVFSVVAAGCSREKGTAPAPGVESGELPPAEGLEEGGRTTPSADPAGTVPGAAQEQPTAPPAEEPKRQEGSSSAKQPEPKKEVPKPPNGTRLDAALVSKGKTKFAEVGCVNCHSIAGKGGKFGPDLAHVGNEHPDVQFYLDLLNDPKKFGKQGMPSFAHLAAEDLRAIAEYLRSLR
ncbi:MAG: hypothetical protein C4341_02135 [Armatimonadota bacterium]